MFGLVIEVPLAVEDWDKSCGLYGCVDWEYVNVSSVGWWVAVLIILIPSTSCSLWDAFDIPRSFNCYKLRDIHVIIMKFL